MSKRLTNYKNKIINEVNELYPDVIHRNNYKEKGVESWGGRDYITNKNSKLNNLKSLKYFVGDILKIEDIIIRRPVEEDIINDERNEKWVPYCVYECVIVKSMKENKYYTLNIDCLKKEEIEKIIREIHGYLNNQICLNQYKDNNNTKPEYYIYDITNHLHTVKNYVNMEKDIDFYECDRLLRNKDQNALSIDEYFESYYFN